MGKRVYGAKDAMLKAFKDNRHFCTVKELVKWTLAIAPKANPRTIEVMLTRDFTKQGILMKSNFVTKDGSTRNRWLHIYVLKKHNMKSALGNVTLEKHYKTLRRLTDEEMERKVKVRKRIHKQPEPTPQDDIEISDVEFGRKIINYIAELKQSANRKDDEMARVMQNFKETERDLKNTISQLNKKLTEQNKLIEELRSKFKIRKKDPDKVFKLSEVAHIK